MGVEPENIIRYRYPGTKFFEADQNDIFFGRKEETLSLIHSIKAHDVFVIFADSGIGKTSLLNAGLIPEFEKESDLQKIIPVKFRFQDTALSPLQIIAKKLSEYVDPDNKEDPTEQTLWRLFKRCVFKDNSGSKEKLPLLVFDQFEEFFNHRKPDREACISELSDLINEYLPDYIQEEMREKFKDRKPTPAEVKYYKPPRLKMLFLIRADKLKLLDDFSKKIPLILRNRFHLKPLNIVQAEQAILFPACLPRNGFASPSFCFQEEAVKQICEYLKNDEEEVESFQLQILCQELEKRVIERYATEKTADAVEISAQELGGEAGMNDITKNYYINKINSIQDKEMRKKAIELIEDKLIVEDRRISQAEFLLLKEGYSRELLDYLLNTTRLIRIDNDRYVEISHDRLLPSILNLKQKRQEEEEKAKAIQQIKEEDEKRKQELQKQKEAEIKKLELNYLKDKVRKAAKLRVYMMILVVLLIGLFWASMNAHKARIQSNIALGKYYMQVQEYDSADKVVTDRSVFSVLNLAGEDTLKKLKKQIAVEKQKKNSFYFLVNYADTLTKAALALVAREDSLLHVTAKRIEENQLSPGDEQEIEKIFIDVIDAQKLIQARKLYDSALSSGFEINELIGPKINTNLQLIEDATHHLFKHTIDATYILLRANHADKAQAEYGLARTLFSFAGTYGIALDPEDTPYLDSLQKIFSNEKTAILSNN